jgi:hypothetical protein
MEVMPLNMIARIFNLVTSVIPKRRTFKLLRWVQNLWQCQLYCTGCDVVLSSGLKTAKTSNFYLCKLLITGDHFSHTFKVFDMKQY